MLPGAGSLRLRIGRMTKLSRSERRLCPAVVALGTDVTKNRRQLIVVRGQRPIGMSNNQVFLALSLGAIFN